MKIPFKNYLLSRLMKQRIDQIKMTNNFPLETQNKVFNYLIKHSKGTKFYNDHCFDKINSYKEYRDSVPPRTYEELYPYINLAKKGHENILWRGKVKYFAKSSGTTNDKSKYIPVTRDSLIDCHFKGGKDMLSIYCSNFPNTRIFNGKGIMLGGSLKNNPSIGYHEGDLSAILLKQFPFWVNMHRVPDISTALMDNWESKLNNICIQSIQSNITNITGVPSWVLVLLRRIIMKTGAKNVSEIWPNLELYMHGGVSFDPYRKQFDDLICSEKINYLEGYNASEGFIAIQDQIDNIGLLLMIDYGIFYEFIEYSSYINGSRDAINLSEVKTGVVYVLLISTNAGLWRYIIGDTIRFVSLNPFRIRIVGRTKSFLNAVGEELMVENADIALKNISKNNKFLISDFIATSFFTNDGVAFHHWLIEVDEISLSEQKFALQLDMHLKKINSDYESKRTDNLLLGNPKITFVKKGTFYRWLKKNNRLGGQNKVPRLDNSTKIFNQIMKIHTTY
tara:strand:- start:33841 stop:35358 length:1518 start_codon:yes stop_codon:yes gene_type:complete